MNENFLSQEEIDALLKSQVIPENETSGGGLSELTHEEMDVLGELGNISMGSAATSLSSLLGHRVSITTPHITISSQKELFQSFEKPFVMVNIHYTEGLKGSNLFIIGQSDVMVIADLMMGGNGAVNTDKKLTELDLSAVSEAMNQMMGSAATAMSNMFGFSVVISPPHAVAVDVSEAADVDCKLNGDAVAVVSFRLEIGDLVDSQLMQVIPIPAAKEMTSHLLSSPVPSGSSEEQNAAEEKDERKDIEEEDTLKQEDQPADPGQMEQGPSIHNDPLLRHDFPSGWGIENNIEEARNLDLILDVPLKVSVVLGHCKRPIAEVLKLVPGTIVELDSLANEPVDILVNGMLIAQGDVVVVNENFGIQVKNIISPEERIHKLHQ